uniref:Uncharacterized protein n=1 Tax=Panagrolaimus davidi TaxID=227884 RepID=A0A914PNZ4_9BILA
MFEFARGGPSTSNRKDPLGLQKDLTAKQDEELEAMKSLELSTSEYIDSLEVYDSSAFLVAVVADISTPQERDGKKKYLKGHLHTPGHIIPFIVWESDIPLHSPKIIVGSKVVIQDAYIAPFNTNYDKTSTVSFQVTLKSHSVITNIGETEDEEVISKYLKMELEEIENASDGILIEITNGFIRTVPAFVNTTSSTSINMCSITDGNAYIQIRLPPSFQAELKKGDPISIKGRLNCKASPIFVNVEDANNFKIKEGAQPLPLIHVLQSNKATKRKSCGQLSDASQPKLKKPE